MNPYLLTIIAAGSYLVIMFLVFLLLHWIFKKAPEDSDAFDKYKAEQKQNRWNEMEIIKEGFTNEFF